jgi:hypothetical protein
MGAAAPSTFRFDLPPRKFPGSHFAMAPFSKHRPPAKRFHAFFTASETKQLSCNVEQCCTAHAYCAASAARKSRCKNGTSEPPAADSIWIFFQNGINIKKGEMRNDNSNNRLAHAEERCTNARIAYGRSGSTAVFFPANPAVLG